MLSSGLDNFCVQLWKKILMCISELIALSEQGNHRDKLESIQQRALYIIYPCHSYLDALNTTNLSSLKERRTQLCRKYIQKMSQNDHPINFLKPRTATSGHSYNLRPGGNNGNNVHADGSCCRTSVQVPLFHSLVNM